MKLIDDLRRENLSILRREFGGLKQLSEKLDREDSQVSQWILGSKNSGTGKPRGMRSDTARFIELKCGKTEGWLDQDHSTEAGSDGTAQAQNPTKTPTESEAVLAALKDWRLRASPKSLEVIDQLTLLAQKNALRDDDWKLLQLTAARLNKAPP